MSQEIKYPLIPENWDDLPVVLYPNPVLRERCVEIDKDYPLDKLLAAMKRILDIPQIGVGIAAPQLGIPVRVFMGLNQQVFVNPLILERKGADPMGIEGCLSVPGVNERVRRKQKIKISFFDENWVEHTKTFKGFEAIVIQHEFDHIEGKLFFDGLALDGMFLRGLKSLEMGIAPEKPYPMKPYRLVPTVDTEDV